MKQQPTTLLMHYCLNMFFKQSSIYSLQKYADMHDNWLLLTKYIQTDKESNIRSLFDHKNLDSLPVCSKILDKPYIKHIQDIYSHLETLKIDKFYIAYNHNYLDLRVEQQAFKAYTDFKLKAESEEGWNRPMSENMEHFRKSGLMSTDALVHYIVLCDIIDYCVFNGIEVINVIEDPTSLKFTYHKRGYGVKHVYFHPLKDGKFTQSYKHKTKGFSITTDFTHEDYLEYAYFSDFDPTARPEKTMNFTLGMTDWIKGNNERTERMKELLHIKDIQGIDYNYLSKYNIDEKQYNHVNKWFPYVEYLEKLKHSKSTLVFQSYATNCFSMKRFLEALVNRCVPLVHSDSNCEIALDSEVYDVYAKHNLIVYDLKENILNHIDYVNRWHDEILNDLYNTNYYKKYIHG